MLQQKPGAHTREGGKAPAHLRCICATILPPSTMAPHPPPAFCVLRCERVLVMRGGRVAALGAWEEVCGLQLRELTAGHGAAALAGAGGGSTADLQRTLAEADVTVDDMAAEAEAEAEEQPPASPPADDSTTISGSSGGIASGSATAAAAGGTEAAGTAWPAADGPAAGAAAPGGEAASAGFGIQQEAAGPSAAALTSHARAVDSPPLELPPDGATAAGGPMSHVDAGGADAGALSIISPVESYHGRPPAAVEASSSRGWGKSMLGRASDHYRRALSLTFAAPQVSQSGREGGGARTPQWHTQWELAHTRAELLPTRAHNHAHAVALALG